MQAKGTSTSNPPDPVPLDYAPASGRRRKLFKRAVLVVALVLLVGSGWHWHAVVWTRTQIYYWQWQCMHYSAPADQIVFDESPQDIPALLNRPGYVKSHHPYRTDAAVFRPSILNVFVTASGVGLIVDSWGQNAPMGMCFLGELKTPSGKSRLVVAQWCGMAFNWPGPVSTGAVFTCFTQPIEPYPLFGPPKQQITTAGAAGAFITSRYASANERIYAGQRDSEDPSHFTIRYEIWGEQDILDGRIDNNDQVTITARHPPTTSPSE